MVGGSGSAPATHIVVGKTGVEHGGEVGRDADATGRLARRGGSAAEHEAALAGDEAHAVRAVRDGLEAAFLA
jgi:hypothetical protein